MNSIYSLPRHRNRVEGERREMGRHLPGDHVAVCGTFFETLSDSHLTVRTFNISTRHPESTCCTLSVIYRNMRKKHLDLLLLSECGRSSAVQQSVSVLGGRRRVGGGICASNLRRRVSACCPDPGIKCQTNKSTAGLQQGMRHMWCP